MCTVKDADVCLLENISEQAEQTGDGHVVAECSYKAIYQALNISWSTAHFIS